MKVAPLFVTGMPRSGTTLLEKLLSGLPETDILSQPFPLLFVEVKREFLKRRGVVDEAFPLGTRFCERRYGEDEWRRFLEWWRPDRPALAGWFARMQDYSGQYTRLSETRLAAVLAELEDVDFGDTLAALCRGFARPEAKWIGTKESFCEEYLPDLLAHGYSAVVVVRDPRDVLASLNHGTGEQHAGRTKSTLFNIRCWRKSVAYCLHLESHGRFRWLRYEDLVARPDAVMADLAAWLGASAGSALETTGAVRDRQGRCWAGNSSFGALDGVSQVPVGRYRGVLPDEVTRQVEALAWPEMAYLGYRTSLSPDAVDEVLGGYRELYAVALDRRGGVGAEADERRAELRRLSTLRQGRTSPAEERELFALPGVLSRLRRSLAAT